MNYSGDYASQMMWDAGVGGGGPFVTCSCGKDHSLPADLSDAEYAAADSFYYVEFHGLLFVDTCDGCKKRLVKYENFIWDNKDHIRSYLKIRIEQELRWAEQENTKNLLAGIK